MVWHSANGKVEEIRATDQTNGGKPLEEQFIQKLKNTYLTVLPIIHLDCFDVSCRVLEISAVEMSAFSYI